MSVSRDDYVMLAVDVGAKGIDYDRFEDEIEGAAGRAFDIVDDAMNGEYCLAGIIIARSDEYEGFEKTVIDPELPNIDRVDLAGKVSAAFGKTYAPDDFKLIIFTRFS